MAHSSQASPDRRWLLVVEMDSTGHWAPCRLVAFADHSDARAVGPDGACTAAAWSADGQWMYFTASVRGQSHLWRQRFPQGTPQQITFGAAEEDGLAVDPSRNSLITSIGTTQSALWIHDEKGERALSSQGEVLNEYSPPQFRENDAVLYYLLRHKAGSAAAELRRVDVQSGKVEVSGPGRLHPRLRCQPGRPTGGLLNREPGRWRTLARPHRPLVTPLSSGRARGELPPLRARRQNPLSGPRRKRELSGADRPRRARSIKAASLADPRVAGRLA